MTEWIILTCEHRKYSVEANSKEEAKEYLENKANLEPKDKKVELIQMGDFEIVGE